MCVSGKGHYSTFDVDVETVVSVTGSYKVLHYLCYRVDRQVGHKGRGQLACTAKSKQKNTNTITRQREVCVSSATTHAVLLAGWIESCH
jgi:hypothetical protein